MLPSGAIQSSVPATALRSARWPVSRLAQVGAVLSSKSAMKQLAPELSALITIFGSTGPVISTRRSSSAAGSGGDPPVAVADRGGVGAEVGQPAGVEERLALAAGGQPGLAVGFEAAVQLGQEGQRGRRQQLLLAGQVGERPAIPIAAPGGCVLRC